MIPTNTKRTLATVSDEVKKNSQSQFSRPNQAVYLSEGLITIESILASFVTSA